MPIILGLSPYKDASPYALWARLIGNWSPERKHDAAQERGLMLEPGILLRIGRQLRFAVVPNQLRWSPEGTEDMWRHATPDGFGPSCVLEAKALESDDGFGESGTSEIRPDYLAQVLWQMACTNLPTAHIGLAYGYAFNGWAVYTVQRDEEREAKLTRRVRAWWERHVLGLTSPPMDGSRRAAHALAAMYGAVTGKTVEATASDLETVRRVRQLDEALEVIREERGELANRLRERLGDATHLKHQHETLVRWTPRKDGSRALTVTRRQP